MDASKSLHDSTDFEQDLNGWQPTGNGAAFFGRFVIGGEGVLRGTFDTLSCSVIRKSVPDLVVNRRYLFTMRVRRSNNSRSANSIRATVGASELLRDETVDWDEWQVIGAFFQSRSTVAEIELLANFSAEAPLQGLNIDIDDLRIVDPCVNDARGTPQSWALDADAASQGASYSLGSATFDPCQGSVAAPQRIVHSAPIGLYPHGRHQITAEAKTNMFWPKIRMEFVIDGVRTRSYIDGGLNQFVQGFVIHEGTFETVQLDLITEKNGSKTVKNMSVYEVLPGGSPQPNTGVISTGFRDETWFDDGDLNGWALSDVTSSQLSIVHEHDNHYLSASQWSADVVHKTIEGFAPGQSYEFSLKARCSPPGALAITVVADGVEILPFQAVDRDMWLPFSAQGRAAGSAVTFSLQVRHLVPASGVMFFDIDDITVNAVSHGDGWGLSEAAIERGGQIHTTEGQWTAEIPTRHYPDGHAGEVISKLFSGLAGSQIRFAVTVCRSSRWPGSPALSISLNGSSVTGEGTVLETFGEWVTLSHTFEAEGDFTLGVWSHNDSPWGNDFLMKDFQIETQS